MVEGPPCLHEKFAHHVIRENSSDGPVNSACKGQSSLAGCSGWMGESLILLKEIF